MEIAGTVQRRPLILVSLLLAAFVINLDITLVNVSIPTLVRQLHASNSTCSRPAEVRGRDHCRRRPTVKGSDAITIRRMAEHHTRRAVPPEVHGRARADVS